MLALRKFYQRLALTLYPFRHWLMIPTLGSAVASVLFVFADSQVSQRYLLPALVTTLWFLFLVSLAYYSDSTRIPPKPRGLVRGIGWSLRNAWIHLLAVMFLLATLGLAYLSLLAARLTLAL